MLQTSDARVEGLVVDIKKHLDVFFEGIKSLGGNERKQRGRPAGAAASIWQSALGGLGQNGGLAKEMLAQEPDDIQERIKTECDEAHTEDIEAYKDDSEGEPLPDAEAQWE
ncbi:hypothetical protein K438DRAFT_1763269 [Mycena galopus ATCC 62051]|nr:hypothetical protein K438DRAFT_1763269 [Mycena galopus ATCC 62051]